MKVKKIALDFGHSSLSPVPRDVGAVGVLKEDDCIKDVHGHLIPELIKLGFELTICTPRGTKTVGESLRERVRIANASNADLFVSLHKNSFSPSANGSEVFISGAASKAKDTAARILGNICELGFRNRGVKHGNFYVVQNTRMPAILVESFFVSNKQDCARFNPKEIALAIAHGIAGNSAHDYPVVQFEKGKLIVKVQTLLKPSTEQSSKIDPDKMEAITPGEYQAELVGEEEGHYLVKFENQKEWFVFSGHADFIGDA